MVYRGRFFIPKFVETTEAERTKNESKLVKVEEIWYARPCIDVPRLSRGQSVYLEGNTVFNTFITVDFTLQNGDITIILKVNPLERPGDPRFRKLFMLEERAREQNGVPAEELWSRMRPAK